jgi:cation:H+ antiporter
MGIGGELGRGSSDHRPDHQTVASATMTALGRTSVQFVGCALLILFAGVRLARYGDVIAEKTGLGATWVGVLMMAAVTSLPELITGASSIVLFDVPDIAAGDAIGSCAFNLMILALLDVRNPEPLSARIHQGHVLSAAFGILQLGLAALAVLAGGRAPMLGWIALHSVLFITLYAFAIRTIFVFERSRLTKLAKELTGEIRYSEFTLTWRT